MVIIININYIGYSIADKSWINKNTARILINKLSFTDNCIPIELRWYEHTESMKLLNLLT